MSLDLNSDGLIQLSREKYDSIKDRVNWSTLKLMDKSPAHYKCALETPLEDTDPLQRGRAVACSIFEPEAYPAKFVTWDGDRRAGKEYKAFLEEHTSFGREVITKGMAEAARAISEAVRKHPVARRYLVSGAAEQTALWTIRSPAMAGAEGYTFRAKGRLDFVSMAGALVDFKSTKDASPEGFARQVLSLGYHCQAAWYCDGYQLITENDLPFILIAGEPVPPYAITVFRVPEDVLQLGRNKYRTHLDRLAACRARNEWPAYADGEIPLALPDWAMGFDEDDESGMGLEIGDASHGI